MGWDWDVCAVGTNFFALTEHCLRVCVRALSFPIRWVNTMGETAHSPQSLIDGFCPGVTFCAIGQKNGACTIAKWKNSSPGIFENLPVIVHPCCGALTETKPAPGRNIIRQRVANTSSINLLQYLFKLGLSAVECQEVSEECKHYLLMLMWQ